MCKYCSFFIGKFHIDRHHYANHMINVANKFSATMLLACCICYTDVFNTRPPDLENNKKYGLAPYYQPLPHSIYEIANFFDYTTFDKTMSELNN